MDDVVLWAALIAMVASAFLYDAGWSLLPTVLYLISALLAACYWWRRTARRGGETMAASDEVRVVAGYTWDRGNEFVAGFAAARGALYDRPALLVIDSGLTAEQMRAALRDDPLDLEKLSDEARREVVAFVDRLRAKHMPYAVAGEAVVRRAVEFVAVRGERADMLNASEALAAAVREMQRHDPRLAATDTGGTDGQG